MATRSSDGFYMTLPSDGSMDVYPDNTLSRFSIHTYQPVDLSEGEWEVGMTEMVFPTSMDNITEDEAFMDFLVPVMGNARYLDDPVAEDDPGRFSKHQVYREDFRIPEGTYDMQIEGSQMTREYFKQWANSDWQPSDVLLYTTQKFEIHRIRFRAGVYTKIQYLLTEMNEGIKLTFKRVYAECGSKAYKTEMKFEWDGVTKRVR